MNSRGPWISHLSAGDRLASSDSVAITPTVQPAAAGTQRKREFDRLCLPEGLPEVGVVTATDREDIPSTRELPGEAPRLPNSRWPPLILAQLTYNARPAREVPNDASWLVDSSPRPSW
jgi:hypothetical protein